MTQSDCLDSQTKDITCICAWIFLWLIFLLPVFTSSPIFQWEFAEFWELGRRENTNAFLLVVVEQDPREKIYDSFYSSHLFDVRLYLLICFSCEGAAQSVSKRGLWLLERALGPCWVINCLWSPVWSGFLISSLGRLVLDLCHIGVCLDCLGAAGWWYDWNRVAALKEDHYWNRSKTMTMTK